MTFRQHKFQEIRLEKYTWNIYENNTPIEFQIWLPKITLYVQIDFGLQQRSKTREIDIEFITSWSQLLE